MKQSIMTHSRTYFNAQRLFLFGALFERIKKERENKNEKLLTELFCSKSREPQEKQKLWVSSISHTFRASLHSSGISSPGEQHYHFQWMPTALTAKQKMAIAIPILTQRQFTAPQSRPLLLLNTSPLQSSLLPPHHQSHKPQGSNMTT